MWEYLKEFNFASVCFRMVLALVAGGIIGFGRARKNQTAGLRTYIVTCVGSTLTTLISFYEYRMLTEVWTLPAGMDVKFDGSRMAAAVVAGIGFLAAGSIILIVHQQVSGLTTAIGLFVTACIGIAAGLGYYELVFLSVVITAVVLELLYNPELTFKRKTRNMTIHVAFDDPIHLDRIRSVIESEGARIYEYEFEEKTERAPHPSLIVSLKLSRENLSHSSLLSSIAELDFVSSVQELIS